MAQSAEPIFILDDSSPEPTPVTAQSVVSVEPDAPLVPKPPADLWMGIVIPGTLIFAGMILTGYEAFRLVCRYRIQPRNPDDDYEFHRFGWALAGPLLLLSGGLQAIYSWEPKGAAIGAGVGAFALVLLMWRARAVTRARELVV